MAYYVTNGTQYKNSYKGQDLANFTLSSRLKSVANNNGIFNDDASHDPYTRFSKYGFIDFTGRLSTTREYMFFTKPDLHIMGEADGTRMNNLNPELENIPFFIDLLKRYPHVIEELQYSYGTGNYPFAKSLTNRLKDTLDLSSLSSSDIDNPTNMYGTDYSYRGSSEFSDDNITFSLEFEDNKYTDMYMFFKAYDMYEQLKRVGRVSPMNKYTNERVIHDQMSVFRFLVGEDLSTIIHSTKIIGVYPTNLPRDAFSTTDFTNGLVLNVSFKGAFPEDDDPLIITDFNDLMSDYKYNNSLSGYNAKHNCMNRKWASGAYINLDENGKRIKYKFVWKDNVATK